ncbi:CRISPR pre-crRNA endoribonuclease Cas5d [Azospirillaceae bacterium]
MSSFETIHCLETWGDFACFTRPEMKIERYSYPVITPSAARGIFDSVLWKPGVCWQPTRVEILSLPRFIGLRRNEVKDKGPSEREIIAWREGKAPIQPIVADGDGETLDTDQKGRTQRQTMALKDVRYRLYAGLTSLPGGRSELRGMNEQFARRARNGQCIQQPSFGCREFPAFFRLVEPDEPMTRSPIDLTQDLGWMVYDTFDLGRINTSNAVAGVSLFRAEICNGTLDIPPYDSPLVVKPSTSSSSSSSF